MKCDEFDKLLDDYIDGQLAPLQQDACRIHLHTCQACTFKLDTMNLMVSGLAGMDPIAMDAKFEQSLIEEFKPKTKAKLPWMGLSAVAAGLLFFLSLNLFMDETIQIPLNQAHKVKLLLESEHDLNDVTFSIELPNHMEISGYGGNHHLKWQGRLKKGENILTVPVLGKREKPGYLIMRVQYKEKQKTLKVRLSPVSDWS